MNSLVEHKINELNKLCVKYRVRRLELFGSAATEEQFDPQTSDLDFLIEFLPIHPGEYADAYFGLLESLNEMFDRPVDLVMIRAIKNPYFLEYINKNRILLYAA